ncbi:Uncharacterised protein [Candidatus Gugararchaeum adminiculabundum]|nr:Uncharacterised protein [Candidatus Gugararchaeum adminiculabundum]
MGHVAFSHEGEAAIERETGSHEELGEKVLKNSQLGDILKQQFAAKEISDLACGKKLGCLIASDLGSDRMDYLKRDSHYTGVAYGVIDSSRLIHTLNFSKGKLLLEKGGLEAAEALLIARFLMFSTVYLHKTVRIASGMLQEAMRLAVSSGALSPVDAVKLDDSQMLSVLKKDKDAAKFVERLQKRELYKVAHRFNPSPNANLLELRKKIASSAGVNPADVLMESGGKPTKKFDITVLTSSGEKNIEELSQLVSAVISAEETRRKTLVAAPREKVEAVKKACEKEFGS